MNIVTLRGTLSHEPHTRELASGSVMLQFDVATALSAGMATVPVVWLDPPATAVFGAGDEVVVIGAVRRRFFRAGGATQSRTEVVAQSIVKSSQRRGAAKLLAQAVEQIEGG